MRRWPVLLLLCLWTAAGYAADRVAVETLRQGNTVEVRASALVRALPETVWGTVTDYDHLAGFVPGMRSSRVVAWRGGAQVVEQRGESRFLVFTYPIDVTLLAVARLPDAVEVHLLTGTLKRLDGVYRLVPAGPGRVELRWTGRIEPDSLPPIFGELAMRAAIRDQFAGLVREIERRGALEWQEW
jgi:ribosome-associated toxin RatA of RatAB toxin-antitoxin module